MEMKWIIKDKADNEKVSHLADVLKIDPAITNLLVQRDIETYEQARLFFRPELSDLHDPFLMKDLGLATE